MTLEVSFVRCHFLGLILSFFSSSTFAIESQQQDENIFLLQKKSSFARKMLLGRLDKVSTKNCHRCWKGVTSSRNDLYKLVQIFCLQIKFTISTSLNRIEIQRKFVLFQNVLFPLEGNEKFEMTSWYY